VFNRLRLYDVVGKPRAEEAAADWYRDIVAALFGSLDPATNVRMIQELFLLIPKKNGKTTYAAVTMLTALIVNRRPAAEFILVAPTINIAARAYKAAKGAIKADPELDKVFHTQDHIQTITHRGNDATLSIKAADTDTITGSLATGTLIDETHVFAKNSRAAEIFLEIRGALAARDDGFLIQITTQSKEPPAGVFKSELELARKIRDGKMQLDPARLAILYELPKRAHRQGRLEAPTLWPLVNPNLGRSRQLNFLTNELITAEADSNRDEKLSLLASQHFNVEIGLAMHADRWIGADYWEHAEDPDPAHPRDADRALRGLRRRHRRRRPGRPPRPHRHRPRDRHRRLALLVARLGPGRRAEAAARERPKLQDLVAAGELTLCTTPPRTSSESSRPGAKIQAAGKLAEKACVGLDPVGVSLIVDARRRRGLTADDGQLVAIPQGYKLNAAVWGAPRKLKDGTLRVAPRS
jgi:phage terminase large subunit-like protein